MIYCEIKALRTRGRWRGPQRIAKLEFYTRTLLTRKGTKM